MVSGDHGVYSYKTEEEKNQVSVLCGVKYKDDRPINTINRIRNILTDLDIFTVEKWFNS